MSQESPDGLPLTGRHALVTGAAGGIGRAIVAGLVGAGASVTLAGRNAERLSEAAAAFPVGRVQAVPGFDVTDAAAVAAGCATARAGFGPVSILVKMPARRRARPSSAWTRPSGPM